MVEALVTIQGLQAKEQAVSIGANLCEKWVVSSERLTGLFWPHQSLHPWKGAVHTPQRCARLGKRLRFSFFLLFTLHQIFSHFTNLMKKTVL